MRIDFTLLSTFLIFLLLSGCGPQDTAISRVGTPDEPPILRILGYAEYLPDEVVERFESENACHLEYEVYDNTDDMLGRMRAKTHRYDLVISSEPGVKDMIQYGVLAQIEATDLNGLENLDPVIVDVPSYPGLNWCLPYCWGSLAIAYRKDKITDPEPTLGLLFSPPADSDVLMLSDMHLSLFLAQLYQGEGSFRFEPGILKSSVEVFREQGRLAGVTFGSDAEFLSGMVEDRYTIAVGYTGDAAVVAAENPNIGYFLPREGAPGWLDAVALSRDAPNPGLAVAFLNFILRPEIMATISNSVRYPNANLAATSDMDPELLGNPVLCPPVSVRSSRFRQRWLSDAESIHLAELTRLVLSSASRSTQ